MDPGSPEVIAARIRLEVQQLERLLARVAERLRESASPPARDSALTATALDMHGWYSGVERIFESVARQLDESVPNGPAWHIDLIEQMMVPIPRLRPAVLDRTAGNQVLEYLKFRHAVRSVYSLELDLERVEELARKLPPVHATVARQPLVFAEFLESA